MKTLKYNIGIILLLSTALSFTNTKHHNTTHNESNIVEINAKSQKEADIKTSVLKLQVLPRYINAPCEVIPNINKSSKVAPRITSQVVKRIVNIGEHVKKGQPLVTLSSIDMAKTQNELLLAYYEWQRVKNLGKQTLGAKRYQAVQINYHYLFAKLIAYGLTNQQVESFLKEKNSIKANGEFTLLSPQNGTIYDANLTDGQQIEQGQVLYHILDESSLWVNASLSNKNAKLIKKNDLVIVGKSEYKTEGKVIQIHHKLEKITRKQIVRIAIPNKNDNFHPGQFVNCRIAIDNKRPVLAIPESSVLRTNDGDWAIYTEVKPNHFKQVEINLVETIDNLAVIRGVKPGIHVVTNNAFAVHSEIMKTGFNPHNH